MTRTYPDDFGFNLASFFPENTGLSVKVWTIHTSDYIEEMCEGPEVIVISQLKEEGGFTVSISDTPRVVYGVSTVAPEELEKIFQWVRINKQPLLDHWNYVIDSFDLADRLVRVDGSPMESEGA